jgi:hypothetical protein
LNWIDKFVIEQDAMSLNRFLSAEQQNGKGLMSNPFDVSKKTKKKKK